MGTRLVRISEAAGRTLRELARSSGKTMQAVLDTAVEDLRRKSFLRRANAAYAALKKKPGAWREELRERKAWDMTVGDDQEGT